jgi:hypothetical protein
MMQVLVTSHEPAGIIAEKPNAKRDDDGKRSREPSVE